MQLIHRLFTQNCRKNNEGRFFCCHESLAHHRHNRNRQCLSNLHKLPALRWLPPQVQKMRRTYQYNLVNPKALFSKNKFCIPGLTLLATKTLHWSGSLRQVLGTDHNLYLCQQRIELCHLPLWVPSQHPASHLLPSPQACVFPHRCDRNWTSSDSSHCEHRKYDGFPSIPSHLLKTYFPTLSRDTAKLIKLYKCKETNGCKVD